MGNLSNDTFRLVIYTTSNLNNKFDSDFRYEYLGSRDAIFFLWWTLKDKYKHVEIYSLDGSLQNPIKGIDGVIGHNI